MLFLLPLFTMSSRDTFPLTGFRSKTCSLFCIGAYLLAPMPVVAEQTSEQLIQLHVKPASCVALHKGQKCFQKIQIYWESSNDREYCLYSDTQQLQLVCATGSVRSFLHNYASESSEAFSLRLASNGETVATVAVNTAWVYRTGKRSSSGWRLF